MTRILIWFYTLLLRLFPQEFRADFGDEMCAVFEQAINTQNSNSKALLFLLRELKDLPVSLYRQYWEAFPKETISMAINSSDSDFHAQDIDQQPGTWGAALMAGLPHLIMGLLIGVGKLGIFDVYQVSETGILFIGISLILLVIGSLLFAWRSGWPLWSASWYLYGAWVTMAVLALTIENLNLQDSWRYTNLLFIGWVGICIIGYFAILLRSKMRGLLSIAFLFPLLSIMMLEFIPNPIEGTYAIGIGLLTALAAGSIIRIGDFRCALGIVLGVNLIAGLTWAYISEYKMLDLPPGIPVHAPEFSNFLELLGLYIIFGLGIIVLPFILRSLWHYGRRKLIS